MRNFVAYLSRLFQTFLTWLIPALFLSIFHNTFSLSNCCTLLLSNSSANFLMSSLTLFLSNSVTFSFPDRGALLLSNSLTLLFILVLGNFLLQLTLVHCYIISFSFSSLLTNLFIFSFALFLMHSLALLGICSVTLLIILSVTLFFMFSFTLFFRYFITLLFWNRLISGNFNSVTLFPRLVVYLSVIHSITLLFILSSTLLFMGGHFAWHLDSVALLPGLIPAFVLPDCGTGRYPTVGTPKQKQKSQYLHNLLK